MGYTLSLDAKRIEKLRFQIRPLLLLSRILIRHQFSAVGNWDSRRGPMVPNLPRARSSRDRSWFWCETLAALMEVVLRDRRDQ